MNYPQNTRLTLLPAKALEPGGTSILQQPCLMRLHQSLRWKIFTTGRDFIKHQIQPILAG